MITLRITKSETPLWGPSPLEGLFMETLRHAEEVFRSTYLDTATHAQLDNMAWLMSACRWEPV